MESVKYRLQILLRTLGIKPLEFVQKDLPNKKIVIVRDDKGELYVKRLFKGKNCISSDRL